MATNSTQRQADQKPQELKKPVKQESTDDYLAPLKSQYQSQLHSLRELFSETWNDDDLISVLQEVQGDLEIAIVRISEGHAQQWSTKPKKGKKEPSTAKREDQPDPTSLKQQQQPRGLVGARGGARGGSRSSRGDSLATRGRGRGRGRGGRTVQPSTRPSSFKDEWAVTTSTSEEASAGWNSKPAATDEQASWGEESTVSEHNGTVSGWSTKAEASSTSASEQGGWASPATEKKSWQKPSASSWSNEEPVSQSAGGWGAPTKKPAPVAASAAVSKPAPVKPAKKGTWAEIAKPEPPVVVEKPKPAPAPVKPPKHEEKKEVVKEVKLTPEPLQSTAAPPGFGESALSPRQNAQAQPRRQTKPETSVTMPANTNVSNIGVQFGSLSLAAVEEKTLNSPLTRQATSPSQQQQQLPSQAPPHLGMHNPYLMMDSSNQSGMPFVNHPLYGHQFSDYSQMYGAGAAQAAAAAQASDQQRTSTSGEASSSSQQAPGYPPAMNANLASMYAAYFPYYMNQFPGASPYGNQPPAGFGQYKFPMYPNAPQQAPTGSSSNSSGVRPPQAQQQGKPSTSQSSQFSAYYGLAQNDEQQHQDYAKFAQQQQQKSLAGDKQEQQPAAYYNQYMQYPGYMPPTGSYPMQQHPSQQSRQQQQQYWMGNQN